MNQTVAIFLLSEGQTWLTQLILAVSGKELSNFNSKWLCYWCRSCREFLLHGPIHRKLCGLMFSIGITSFGVVFLFFLYWSRSSSLCVVFDAVSSYIDEVLSMELSDNVLSLETFKVPHKDWLIYSGRIDITGQIL